MMKIALDPYMFRRVPLTELTGLVADLGYSYIELSPREDFLPFFLAPAGRQGAGRGVTRRCGRADQRESGAQGPHHGSFGRKVGIVRFNRVEGVT
jgi:hypothetical protein